MNAELTYDGRLPVEITDMFLKQLDGIIEHDNRLIGQQEMQFVVLRWAVSFKDALSEQMRESLIETMERRIADTQRARPAISKVGEEV